MRLLSLAFAVLRLYLLSGAAFFFFCFEFVGMSSSSSAFLLDRGLNEYLSPLWDFSDGLLLLVSVYVGRASLSESSWLNMFLLGLTGGHCGQVRHVCQRRPPGYLPLKSESVAYSRVRNTGTLRWYKRLRARFLYDCDIGTRGGGRQRIAWRLTPPYGRTYILVSILFL